MAQVQKAIDSLMTENRTFPPPASIKANAHISSMKQYQQMWEKSIKDPDGFWLEQAKIVSWFKKPTRSLKYTWDTKKRKIEHSWFADGELNVAYNCLDRHLGTPTAKKTALIWQGEAEGAVRKFTYEELHKEVCKFANVLKSKGIKKGDRVAIYLPMIPELPIAMLACPVLVRFTRLFSADSAPIRCRAASTTPSAKCLSLPMFHFAAASILCLKAPPMKH